MENSTIRAEAKRMGVRHWQIADRLGVSEQTFVRWMRKELPVEQRKAVMEAIHDISASRKGEKQ